MSFKVRRIEDPAIYVRRNKPDILGISNAWDNIVDFKAALNRLEDNIEAADTRQKTAKKHSSLTGPVLKEISSETQRFGKVTRFQLLGEKPSYKSLPHHSSSAVEIKTRRNDADYSKSVSVPNMSSVNREPYPKSSQDVPEASSYSPSRYTANKSKRMKKSHNELPSFFKTTTINPVILNETSDESNHTKDGSYANVTVNSSVNSQQFSLTSSPSFHGKAVLAKNEVIDATMMSEPAALQKIKEKVQKQKAMLSKQDEEINSNPADRKLHDSKDRVTISTEPPKKNEMVQVPLKRKVGTTSSSGPAYRGFNPVSTQKIRKYEQKKPKLQQSTKKTSKEDSNKGFPKPSNKQETKLKKGKMNRIIGPKCPKEVISTTSWRDGQATVKRILGVRKAKPKKVSGSEVEKTDTTYRVSSPSHEELSEGKLTDEDDKVDPGCRPKAEKVEDEKNTPEVHELDRPSEIMSCDSDVVDEEKLKDKNVLSTRDVLSTEAQSMLADLAQDSSESESEVKEEEKPKASEHRKKLLRGKRPRTAPKPVVEEKYPKEKTRHYDQTEVQKYMAQQIAERKKKLKQEKILKKKQEEEKQQRLKDLYERQKKSIAAPKKEKRFGQTFSCGESDLRIPGQESYPLSSEEYAKTDDRTSQNESDKENTDISDFEASSDCLTDGVEDNNVSVREGFLLHNEAHNKRVPGLRSPILIDKHMEQVPEPAHSLPLDKRAQRLSALRATALALQTRLQSQALRLGAVSEHSVSQPVPRVGVQTREEQTGFKGILPGVTNTRVQADDNEKQLARVQAATKIQAAYRGHNVRKKFHWKDGNAKSDDNTVISSAAGDLDDDDGMYYVADEYRKYTDSSAHDDVEYSSIHSLRTVNRLRRDLQLNDYRTERSRFQPDISVPPSTHFSVRSVPFEPRGDRYSVMNIFARRHPTIPVEDILDEKPGSETASLLEAGVMSKTSDPKMEYEDDFTGEDISTASVLTEGDLKKESSVMSKVETYSECFESDDHCDLNEQARLEGEDMEQRSSGKSQRLPSPTSTVDDVVSVEGKESGMVPVMTSTIHPEHRPSPPVSLSDESEPLRQLRFMKPVEREGGNRLSPESLRRKLTGEINFLENVEDSVRQVNDIEKTRAVSLAQQETVSLAQILKAQQHNHEQELKKLGLKAKEEAIQAAKDLEKTRQAAALAASSAAQRLAEVRSEVIKTNSENSKKYLEETSKMASTVLSNTTNQLAEFCRDVTATTSAAIMELHKIDRPTTTLVERATSFSEYQATDSENSSGGGSYKEKRTRDSYSHPSKSWEASRSAISGRRRSYSSDEFESYVSGTARNEESDIKTKLTKSGSLSAESILEDLPDKSASEDNTMINDESANDSQSQLTEKSEKLDKGHGAASPFPDSSSQFEDSSHALTDDDLDFPLLFPSKEHRKRSIKRIKDHSFDEDKGKERTPRTPFESDDSFGKFTVEMIKQYMKEEEVRTKHQAAILSLREKSLKEKMNAELQWLEQLKKRSRDKGSDDVMPSIEKRERGILMKFRAEKEEIKCLKAANKAASYQRRFMIYQQHEINRLHQATMHIRKRIEGDVSGKDFHRNSHETSENHHKTSSLSKTDSNTQSSPSDSFSKVQKSLKTSIMSSGSPARSVSEDIVEDSGTSGMSPAATESPFPSYSTPKAEPSREATANLAAQQLEAEPDTSTILNMLSFVASGELEFSSQNGESLLKIHKMLLEKQQKLVKDESEVNSMLQKVAEMINNRRNDVTTRSSPGHSKIESAQTSRTGSNTKRTKPREDTKSVDSRSETSILEDLPSTEKSRSEQFKENSEKPPGEYSTCTFESDETSPSRPSSVSQASSVNGEVQVEKKPSSPTETSDYSDYEEGQRVKMKAEALKKKIRKKKRSAVRKEPKSTREETHRKPAEIKTAPDFSSSPPLSTPSIKSNKSSRNSLNEELSRRTRSHLQKSEVLSASGQQKSYVSRSKKNEYSQALARNDGANDEVEESLIETLDGPSAFLTSRDDSRVSEKNEASDIPEEISERAVTDTHSAASIPEEMGIAEGEQDFHSKASDIPEEILDKSYTEPQSSPNVPERSPSVVEDLQDSHEYEESYTQLRRRPTVSDESASIAENLNDSLGKMSMVSDEEFLNSYTEPRSTTSISNGSPINYEKQKESKNRYEDFSEPKSDWSIVGMSPQKDLALDSKASEVFEISENLPAVNKGESGISEKIDENTEKSFGKGFPSLEIVEDSKLSSKDAQASKDLQTLSVDASTPVVPETSNKLTGRERISERQSVVEGVEDVNGRSQSSSIAEEIISGYDEEDITKLASMKEGSEELIFGDIDETEQPGAEEKESVELDYSDTFTHASVGNTQKVSSKSQVDLPIPAWGNYHEEKIISPRSGSSKSEELVTDEKMRPVLETEPKSHKSEDEQQYSENFEAEDETVSEDFPEIIELGEVVDVKNSHEKNHSFETFKSDNDVMQMKEIGDESRSREKDLMDNITDEIYRKIMIDSLNCMTDTKDAKSRRIKTSENRMPSEIRGKVKDKDQNMTDGTTSGRVGEKVKDKDQNLKDGNRVRRVTIDTDDITKDLLAEAIMQMIAIKRRKKEIQESTPVDITETKLPSISIETDAFERVIPTATTPTENVSGYDTAKVTSPPSVGAGGGAVDEVTVVHNALIIAKSNQALDHDTLKVMDQDIEGLLGVLPDDDDNGDFQVNENKLSDIPSDDNEPSIHEFSPMFAVPHNLQEVTLIVNSAVDVLFVQKREGTPLDMCKPPAQLLNDGMENELENRSKRSYRNLMFDLTKEVFTDIVSQEVVASRPPWAKAKWKGGQKLSRNFERWKSDDEMRAVVLERVTNLIGLGAPRPTMQTLLRKTPVRGNKKDNVDAILIEELREEEPQWTDYDEDETSVKFQVADSILNMLLDDTVRVFNAIQAKKNVPDNVLVV